MQQRQIIHNLQVATCLYDFIEDEVLKGLPINSTNFWDDFSALITQYMPENKQLLDTRKSLQQQIDTWHQSNGPCDQILTPLDQGGPSGRGHMEKHPFGIGQTAPITDPVSARKGMLDLLGAGEHLTDPGTTTGA